MMGFLRSPSTVSVTLLQLGNATRELVRLREYDAREGVRNLGTSPVTFRETRSRRRVLTFHSLPSRRNDNEASQKLSRAHSSFARVEFRVLAIPSKRISKKLCYPVPADMDKSNHIRN